MILFQDLKYQTNHKPTITGEHAVKKSLLITLAILLLTVSSVSGQACFITAAADGFNQTTYPSEISSENYKLDGGITANSTESSRVFEWGKNFNEIGFTAGAYGNDEDLRGWYFMAEANHWQEEKYAGRNWSFLGACIMYEPGSVGDYDWKKMKVLYQPGLYQVMGDQDDYHLLLKPRIGVSINRGTEREENFVYGAYAELDKVFNPLNRAGLIFDAIIEARDAGEDGYVNPRIFYEIGWPNGVTLMPSIGPIWHITPDETKNGFTPALSLRIPLDADLAIQFGASADIMDNVNTYGGFISLTWNDISYAFKQKKQ